MAKRTIILISPLVGMYGLLYKTVPLPLLAICRNLSRDKYDIIIVDQKIECWQEKLKSALKKEPLLIGITCLTGYQLLLARRFSERLRQKTNVPIVFGGMHPSCRPRELLEENIADYVLIGEADDSFPILAEAIANGRGFGNISGLAYWESGRIRINKVARLPNLKTLPQTPYGLIRLEDYDTRDGVEMQVEDGRGCVFSCSYCYHSSSKKELFGTDKNRWRTRDIKDVAAEIEQLAKMGARRFQIVNDSFLIDSRRAERLAELLIRKNLGITYTIEANLAHLSRLDKPFFWKLYESGLRVIDTGVESGSSRERELFNKKIDVSRLLKFNRMMASLGITVKYNFMTGSLIQQPSDLRKTVSLVRKLKEDNPSCMIQSFYLVVPYPDTVYYELARAEGFAEPSTAGWGLFDPYSVSGFLPWYRGKRKAMSDFLMITSSFIDFKADYYLRHDSPLFSLLKALASAYRPIARFRFYNLLYWPFPEKHLFFLANRQVIRNCESEIMRI